MPQVPVPMTAGGAEAYEAISEDGQRVGGAIIAIDKAEHRGELAFLYVKVGVQSKGIGQSIWKVIEAMHPEIEVWETCTPFFDRRDIHSTSTAADSMPLSSCVPSVASDQRSSASTSIIQTPICLSSLTRRTVCLSLRKE